ncbi:MAG: tetratricopeptide repeat protein, partial [Ignavibacteriaceae bacterium]|nr:tetratricopeptide repeat protein [Ignavibacteriaceae bacterium]
LLNLAKELDALRFRAPKQINEVIENLGKEFKVEIVDIDSIFRAHSPNGIVGYDLTVDHLHPNIEGYSLISKSFFNKMEELNYLPLGVKLELSIDEQDSILGYNFPFTKLDSTIAEMQIIQLTGAYPFVPKGTPNYKKINYKIDTFIDSLSLSVINKDIKWETAHVNLAERYYNQGNFENFIKEAETIIQERPYFDQPYEFLITKLVDAGFVNEAIPYLYKLYSFKPSYFATKWLGQSLLYNRDYKNSLKYLREAVLFSEADSQTWYNLGGAYYYNGQIKEALNALTNSLNLNPDNKLAKDFYEQIMSLPK